MEMTRGGQNKGVRSEQDAKQSEPLMVSGSSTRSGENSATNATSDSQPLETS